MKIKDRKISIICQWVLPLPTDILCWFFWFLPIGNNFVPLSVNMAEKDGSFPVPVSVMHHIVRTADHGSPNAQLQVKFLPRYSRCLRYVCSDNINDDSLFSLFHSLLLAQVTNLNWRHWIKTDVSSIQCASDRKQREESTVCPKAYLAMEEV